MITIYTPHKSKEIVFFQTSKQFRLVFKSNIEFKFIVFSYYTDDQPS
ncbi:hypothetical protein pfor_5c0618 [Rhodobacteraceae bacterium SB2]|nr:hypothetical protein pfor_5c0618 [Rhodobacteraceae bacterium SB2]